MPFLKVCLHHMIFMSIQLNLYQRIILLLRLNLCCWLNKVELKNIIKNQILFLSHLVLIQLINPLIGDLKPPIRDFMVQIIMVSSIIQIMVAAVIFILTLMVVNLGFILVMVMVLFLKKVVAMEVSGIRISHNVKCMGNLAIQP